jgi:hypothetical protein
MPEYPAQERPLDRTPGRLYDARLDIVASRVKEGR